VLSSPARRAALLLAAVLTLTACGSGDDSHDAAAGPVQADGQSVGVDDFAALADTDGVVVLDVRTPEEFAEGHLEGAVNLDVSSAAFADGLADLDPAATYAVYCRSGNRSQTALAQILDAGIPAVVDLTGGIQAWTQAGRAVVTGP